MACDWQLNTRTTYWQSAMSGGQVSSKYLQSFEKDMNSLRRVSEGLLVSISILKSRYLDNHHKQKLFSIVQEQDI